MMKIKTEELTGAALDWAVITATKLWETAHQHFPTMTLDPTFSGVEVMILSNGEGLCRLVPRNPMRQDYQICTPSTSWELCGPLISSHGIKIGPKKSPFDMSEELWFAVSNDAVRMFSMLGETPLIAACRAIVAVKMGDYVEIPDELGTGQ